MTGAMHGSDVEEVRLLAQHFETAAARLELTSKLVRARLYSCGWDGRDAQDFKRLWEGQLQRLLSSNAQYLRACGQRLLDEAAQQDAASRDGAGAARPLLLAPLPWSSFDVRPLPRSGLGWDHVFSTFGVLGLFGQALSGVGTAVSTRRWLTQGDYTARWHRVIDSAGDAFRYKRSPILQWGAKAAPFLSSLGPMAAASAAIASADNAVRAAVAGDVRSAAVQGAVAVTSAVEAAAVVPRVAAAAGGKLNPLAALTGANIVIWNEVFTAAEEAGRESEGLGTTLRNSSVKDIGKALGEGALEAGKRLWKAFT